MKLKKILTSILVMSLTLGMISFSGCSDSDSDDDNYDDDEYYDDSEEYDDTDDSSDSEEENRVYLNGATQLSLNSGELTVNRRSRTDEGPMGDSGWTILVYMCGTDLESEYAAASSDIAEAISAQYSDDVRIVYQTGGTNEWQCGFSSESIQRYANIDGDVELVDEIDNASMGDSQTLADFVSWGVENYPAKRMGLVFWNHGGGSISGVCFDELNDSDSLSLREVDNALNSVYDQMTDKFEFIGFDACLMSTLETANILVPYARYMFASEETEPGGGWNYTDIMNYLAENPDADGAELGAMQCESYYQHCIDNGDSDGTTFAITDLSKIDELVIAFNETAQEMYEGGYMNEIAREIYKSDNFGGNNRNEGYTNMVDMLGLLNATAEYCNTASDAIEALNNAVISKVNGPMHEGAGGLSLYYPLSVQGSQELSIFADICTSTYYLAFVDAMAYGTTGGDVDSYDNSQLYDDCDDFWSCDYSFDGDAGTNSGDFDTVNDDSTISISDIYFDEDGTYTVQLFDTNYFNYAACSLYTDVNGTTIYLGEDDEVDTDLDEMTLRDTFDGSWPSINGSALAIETVSVGDDRSIYTCPILLNGEPTNLRIEYDFSANKWEVIGAWSGIDPNTGMASRDVIKLANGDVITPVYYVLSDNDDDYYYGEEYTVEGEITIEYEALPAADYYYSMSLYDVYGNVYYTDFVTFTYDENGELYFYPDDLTA